MKEKSSRNQTLECDSNEIERLSKNIKHLDDGLVGNLCGQVILGDTFEVAVHLPKNFVDLLILDPPYNLSKNYNGLTFKERSVDEYRVWFENLISKLTPCLKQNATVYVCSDWKTSTIIAPLLEEHFHVRNRITWEREKGRGAKTNWKNNTEDIWFCTVSDKYCFNVDDVKLKRRVITPYRSSEGTPKDWNEEDDGKYRLTYPSNIWTDITVPFWSMPENTDHPTQKPEKLIAKLLLASSNTSDVVFDPFLGSGTTAVVSKKLGRNFFGIEMNREYCCWALKRLEIVEQDKTIQGYVDGVFWERNSLNVQQSKHESVI